MYTMSKNKRLLTILLAVPVLLLIPLIAMQFTSEVDWNAFDFLVMGTLLVGVGISVEFVLRKFSNKKTALLLLPLS